MIQAITLINDFFWGYVGFVLIILFGLYFSFKTRFFQFKVLCSPKSIVKESFTSHTEGEGILPIKLFFASVSGMVGIGNLVGVVTAVTIGGPGALLWLWLASLAGMLIKYAEVYLGISYREKENGIFVGGPMYYLRKSTNNNLIGRTMASVFCLLLIIYGVDVFQFVVITDALTSVTNINKDYVVVSLLALTLYGGLGGVKRLANICMVLSPIFIIIFVTMCCWIILVNIYSVPELLLIVAKSAFSGHAAIGGFAGSSLIMAIQHGTSQAVYSGDIGIGFDSIIHSETTFAESHKQARMVVWSMLFDMILNTMAILVILVTGAWAMDSISSPSDYLPTALSGYFLYSEYFMAFFIFIAGWTTVIGYLAVGLKSAQFLFPRLGFYLFFAYATIALYSFAYHDQFTARTVMTAAAGCLVLINLFGILLLRNKVEFRCD